MYDLINWALTSLSVLPNDPDEAATRFHKSSSTFGDRARPWLFALIAVTLLVLLFAVGIALMS